MEGKINICLFEAIFFSTSSWLHSRHDHLHLLLCRELRKASSLQAWLACPQNSGVSEHLFSPKPFHGSTCPARTPHLPRPWPFPGACHCSGFPRTCEWMCDPGQAGTVATVNGSDCQKGNDHFQILMRRVRSALLQFPTPWTRRKSSQPEKWAALPPGPLHEILEPRSVDHTPQPWNPSSQAICLPGDQGKPQKEKATCFPGNVQRGAS